MVPGQHRGTEWWARIGSHRCARSEDGQDCVSIRNGENSPSAGVLATAGGLVFTGDAEGYVIALDALSGKALWRFQAGGTVLPPPIS